MQTLRRFLALPLLALLLALAAGQTLAEARVFDLTTPNPDEIVRMLQTTYGDKVRIDVVQQRLVVVGSAKQLDEIAGLLAKLDRPPAALRLTLRETPPPVVEREGTVVYSSGDDGRVIDTVESALVAIDYQQIVQQPASDGWLVAIENQPLTVSSLTVQVQLQNSRTAQVLVSFADERNQQRRVYSNTLTGEIGEWIALLPRKTGQLEGPGAYSTGPKRGEQVYLRIERKTR
jgi:hypothetical protein